MHPSLRSTTSRYLVRECIAFLIPVLLTFLILYLIVDFFDRLGLLLRTHANPLAAARYFLFKIPLIFTQIMPPAVLTAMLVSLGMLSRRNEIVAWRASGISLTQTAVPLLALAAAISVGTLVWNETVVPYCMREYQYINNIEIRKRPQRGILSERGIWYHGAAGFYSIDQIDPRRGVLLGVVPAGVARWVGREVDPCEGEDGRRRGNSPAKTTDDLPLPEGPITATRG